MNLLFLSKKWLINQLVGGLSINQITILLGFLKVKVCKRKGKVKTEDDLLESAEFVYTMSEVFPIFGI